MRKDYVPHILTLTSEFRDLTLKSSVASGSTRVAHVAPVSLVSHLVHVALFVRVVCVVILIISVVHEPSQPM